MYTTLISAEQLKHLVHDHKPLMVFDCSFELMKPAEGDAQYERVRIAGAVRANVDRHLSAKDKAQAVNGGRHPLPRPEAFAAWLARVGFQSDMQAVVYDRQGANYCGRLWWMLKWVGHENVAVLDGGLQAWEAVNGPVATGPDLPRVPSAFKAGAPRAQLATTEDVLKHLELPDQTLIDARAPARFRGEVEPLDPVAGHIPGALNRPFGENLGPDGKFKSPAQLKAEFQALLGERRPQSVVHHCGSGVSALPNLLAMEIAGLGRGALYAGSWSEWCASPDRPVARG
ncbi:sulfurtransferase [Curvibacter sp. PAE-UM]|uniref:sulfurtransferase n=1 Tax=Curvibacter sp. PAE-UM TaxID=1714344 RepID=UPI00070D075C|nr:sulfurtransferase [Curvibacter sp. PAE-UM]KRI00052.1 3-mercaptopyruvate sulfurtransferase [Curvibacter sp. PAE-UM]